MNTAELLERWPALTSAQKAFFRRAIATRGKHAGYVRTRCPDRAKDRSGWLAWQVLVSQLAPQRVSARTLVAEHAGIEYNDWLQVLESARKLHIAIRPIEPEFRWSLYAMNHNVAAERAAITAWLKKQESQT